MRAPPRRGWGSDAAGRGAGSDGRALTGPGDTEHVEDTEQVDTSAFARMSVRAQELLRRWHPPDSTQARLRAEFLAHLAEHPDAMARSGPPAHLTASCLVMNPERDRVLLTLHGKAGRWFQFGGHFEPGDVGPLEAATREAREESGISDLRLHPELVQLDRHALDPAFTPCREHLDLRFAATASPRARHMASPESLDVRWWPVSRLPRGSRREISRLAAAAARVLA